MSTIKQSRRSPRLMEKEATQKIAEVLADAGIPARWVFDDALFAKRWAYEQLLAASQRVTYCRCCSYDAEEGAREYEDVLPYNNFTKEDVVKPIGDLLALSQNCGQTEMRIIYSTALFRLIHGPARCLLKFDKFRAMAKAKCSDIPQQACYMGLADSEFGERLLDACWAVAELIHQKEDEDGYNIFHGF